MQVVNVSQITFAPVSAISFGSINQSFGPTPQSTGSNAGGTSQQGGQARVPSATRGSSSSTTSSSATATTPSLLESRVSVNGAWGKAVISEVAGLYVARSKGPPPTSVSGNTPAAAVSKLQVMVDIYA